MERAKPGIVLRTSFLQLDVLAHNANDVGLLLDGIGEITRIGHGATGGIVSQSKADVNIAAVQKLWNFVVSS